MKRENKKKGNKIRGFEKENFTIDKSAEAFDLISNNIYSRPVEAIIRELCCNAYDSHVQAGKENEPFDVKIPTRHDPTFYVRDYGVSLTEEEVDELYTVVFKSDKTDTNEQTGCFGVGSKSPFAYTDEFNLQAIKDGQKRVYKVTKDENGVPSIIKLGSQESNEAQGVKIGFEVDQYDTREFKNAAQRVLKFFQTKPNIKGCQIDIDTEEPLVSGDNWELHENKNKNYAIMGNVAYEIDNKQIPAVSINGVWIYFDLGELNPAASREHIQYDEETKEKIGNVYKEIREKYQEKAEKKVKDADDYFDACIKYTKFHFKKPNNIQIEAPDYNGEKVEAQGVSKWIDHFDKKEGTKFHRISGSNDTLDKNVTGGRQPLLQIKTNSWQNRIEATRDFRDSINIIWADQSYGKYSRSEYKHQSSPEIDSTWIIETDNKEEVERFCEYFRMEKDDFLRVSELDSKPSPTSTDKGKSDVLKLNDYRNKYKKARRHWDTPDENIHEQRAYYVVCHRYKFGYEKNEHNNYNSVKYLKEVLASLEKKNIHIENVIGVKHRYLDDAEKNENWRPLIDLFEDMADYFHKQIRNYKIQSKFRIPKFARRFYKSNDEYIGLIQDPLFHEIYNICSLYEEEDKTSYPTFIEKLNRFADIDVSDEVEEIKSVTDRLDEINETIQERYPYVNFYKAWKYDLDQESLDYVNALYNYKYK